MQTHGIFCIDFARKVVDFGDNNSASSHADDQKSHFQELGESPTYVINGI